MHFLCILIVSININQLDKKMANYDWYRSVIHFNPLVDTDETMILTCDIFLQVLWIIDTRGQRLCGNSFYNSSCRDFIKWLSGCIAMMYVTAACSRPLPSYCCTSQQHRVTPLWQLLSYTAFIQGLFHLRRSRLLWWRSLWIWWWL